MRDKTNNIHPFLDPFPVVCAHRGDSAHFPENTLPAFMSSAELGVDCIESDVHLTADGECVLWHDSTVDRMTNGIGKIHNYTLKELKELDAGYGFFDKKTGQAPFRNQGTTIPTLSETLRALPDMRFNLDLKGTSSTLAEKFVETVKHFQAEKRILGASFHHQQVKRVRRLLPTLATSFSSREVKALVVLQRLGVLKVLFPFNGITLQVPETYGHIRIVSPTLVRVLHEKGVSIQVWTINYAEDMHRLLDMGVDGIVTDDPRVLMQVLAERK